MRFVITTTRRPKSTCFGATAVEFVIGFPLMVLLFMFMVDARLYLFQKAIVTDSTARLNREIVTQLGQKEAEAYDKKIPGPSCADLRTVAFDLKDEIVTGKPVLHDGLRFSLKISKINAVSFRLVTTTGEKGFICLTCKFFTSAPWRITSRSVLVIERPDWSTTPPPTWTPGIRCPIPNPYTTNLW